MRPVSEDSKVYSSEVHPVQPAACSVYYSPEIKQSEHSGRFKALYSICH